MAVSAKFTRPGPLNGSFGRIGVVISGFWGWGWVCLFRYSGTEFDVAPIYATLTKSTTGPRVLNGA